MSSPVIDLLQHLASEMPRYAEDLSELDARIGDGDLGSTIQHGFKSLASALNDLRGRSPGEQLIQAGMAFNRGGASTFGALMATALMNAGRAVQGKQELTPQDVPAMGQAALQGMMKRGKAQLGDKTMLDALAPAIEAFASQINQDRGTEEALRCALEAAQAAVERTAAMPSKVSRAGWLTSKSVGVPDPGAVAVVHMLQVALSWVAQDGAQQGSTAT